jgi:hypothetical protein
MPPSSAEREIRLLRSYKEPTLLQTINIPELGLVLTPSYDAENDAFSVDFGREESTFDLPEPDGRLIWRIGRRTEGVAGFTVVGVRENGISEITTEFIVKRKHDIERGLRRIHGVGVQGRATRDMIEQVIVTATTDDAESARPNAETENAWGQVVSRLRHLATV